MTSHHERFLRQVASDLRAGRLPPDYVESLRERLDQFRQQLLDKIAQLEESRDFADSARLYKEYLTQKLEDKLNDLRRNQSPEFTPFRVWMEAAKHVIDQISTASTERKITDMGVALLTQVGLVSETISCLASGDTVGAADRLEQYLDSPKPWRGPN